ncbi:MAG: hypothetical protein KAG61_07745 [Bacteriovoracaceae bacterium]|nr:hypothetical protein [Bacteriovoracaceae bacterium]
MELLALIVVSTIWGLTLPFVQVKSHATKVFSVAGGLSILALSIQVFILTIGDKVLKYTVSLDRLTEIQVHLVLDRANATLILLSSILLLLFLLGTQKGNLRKASLGASFIAFTSIVLAVLSRSIFGFFIAFEVASIALYFVMPIRSNKLMKRTQSVMVFISGLMLLSLLYIATSIFESAGDLALSVDSLKSIIEINTPDNFLSEILFFSSTLYVLSRTVIFPASFWQSKFTSTLGRSAIALHISLPAIGAYAWFTNFTTIIQPELVRTYQTPLLITLCIGAIYNIFISLGQRKLERDAIFFSSTLLAYILANILLLSEDGARSGLIGVVFLSLLNSYISVVVSALDRVFGSTLIPLCERSDKYSAHFLRGIVAVFLLVMGTPGGIGFTFFYSSLVAGINHSNLIGGLMLVVWVALMGIVIQKIKMIILNAPEKIADCKIQFNRLELFIMYVLFLFFILGGIFPRYLFS